MRLFAAMPLPEAGRLEYAAVLASVREAGWPVRWVRDDSAHITLKFFGEVAPNRLDVIAEAVTAAASGDAVPLRLQGLGAFPTFRHPRVVWLGVEAPPALGGSPCASSRDCGRRSRRYGRDRTACRSSANPCLTRTWRRP